MTSRIAQRGAVVVVAMIIVAVAAIAASTLLQQQDVAVRQLEAGRDYEQARWLLTGGVQWARVILRADALNSGIDYRGELWATGLPLTQVERGSIAGEISDAQALFNLNNVCRDGKASEPDIAVLKRLLKTIGLSVDLADAIVDWIDSDSDIRTTESAEDDYYLSRTIPYRAANQPLASIEELLRVRGFDAAIVAQLRQFTTVLPQRTPVNVNTAPPEVLVAIVSGLTLPEATVLAASRSTTPFRSRDDFLAKLPRMELRRDDDYIAVASSFFWVRGRAIVGKATVQIESLLRRDGSKLPSIYSQWIS